MASLAAKRKIRFLLFFAVATIGLLLVGFGARELWLRYRSTHTPHPAITKTVITKSTDRPDETPPTAACTDYKVGPSHPQRIDLPSIGSSGCIQQVGIDQHGRIAVPTNIYTAAWYVKSALPGQPGLSIIDGHISGRYNTNGIFQRLAQLKPGDTFTVTLGDDTVLSYRVFKRQSVPLSLTVGALLTQDTSKAASQLNLITCSGQYNKSTNIYDHRTIVSAELL
jgi:LPXTG-site transpeptidase (sortase) family protein